MTGSDVRGRRLAGTGRIDRPLLAIGLAAGRIAIGAGLWARTATAARGRSASPRSIGPALALARIAGTRDLVLGVWQLARARGPRAAAAGDRGARGRRRRRRADLRARARRARETRIAGLRGLPVAARRRGRRRLAGVATALSDAPRLHILVMTT